MSFVLHPQRANAFSACPRREGVSARCETSRGGASFPVVPAPLRRFRLLARGHRAIHRLCSAACVVLFSLGIVFPGGGLPSHAAPADPPVPPLVEFTPWLVKNQGPAGAKGVIYFVRGWSEGLGLDAFELAPYIMTTLNAHGWDVVVAKYPQGDVPSRMRYESVPGAAKFLRHRAEDLKAQGYKRIVLAGQSWGSWVAMAADQQKGLPADALWLIVPNIYGPKTFDTGEKNSLFRLNYTKFAALVPALNTPAVLNTFTGDRWEPGNRAALLRKHFETDKLPSLIVDEPQGFSGHFAGWLPIYDFAYGACIESFLEGPSAVTCSPPPLANDDFRSIFNISQVAGAEQKRVTSGDVLSGKDFVVFNLGLPNKQYHYLYSYKSAAERDTLNPLAQTKEQVAFRDGQQCVGTACTTLIAWSEGRYLEFDPKSGSLLAWWIQK